MYYYILAFLLFAADQVTKYFTVKNLEEFESFTAFEGFLHFTRFHNTGGPWSIFDNLPIFFVIVTIAIFVFEIIYFRKHPLTHPLSKIAAVLINSGALGNLADRMFRGYVVDMIEVKFIDYPVFNFADCCIVIGCLLMCIYVLFVAEQAESDET